MTQGNPRFTSSLSSEFAIHFCKIINNLKSRTLCEVICSCSCSCDKRTPARLTHYSGRCHLNHIKVKVKKSYEQRTWRVGARGIPALLVHREHIHASSCCSPRRTQRYSGVRVTPALLVHRAHVPRKAVRLAERSGAVGARVVPALLVHSAHMLPQVARLAERSGAVGARVVPAPLRSARRAT